MRCLYLAILAVALGALRFGSIPDVGIGLGTHASHSELERGAFAHSAVMLVLFLQTGAILLLTPAYLASAFTEEKERHTLQLLFLTGLSNHELVLGKLFSRLALLGTFLIVSLPLMIFCLGCGPVDFSLIITGIVASALALLSMGSISILSSVWSRTTHEAVLTSYGLVIVMGISSVCLPPISPVLFVPYCEQQVSRELEYWENMAVKLPTLTKPNTADIRFDALVPYSVAHGLIFLFCVGLCIWVVRKNRLSSDDTFPSAVDPLEHTHFPKPRQAILAQPAGAWRHDSFRIGVPVKEPALLWKEMELGEMRLPATALGNLPALIPWKKRDLVSVVATIAFVYYFRWIVPKERIADFESGAATLIGYASVFGMGIWSLFLSFRVAGSITREREHDTLDGLLMLPGERDEVLRAKWLGSILRFGQLGYALGVMWLLGLITGILHPLALIFLVTTCTTYLLFSSAVGLWISLISRSTLWANISMALLLTLCFSVAIAKLMANTQQNDNRHSRWLCQAPEALVNPGYAILVSAFSRHALDDALAQTDGAFQRKTINHGTEPYGGNVLQNLTMIPVNLAFFGSAAWVFWQLSRRKFRSMNF